MKRLVFVLFAILATFSIYADSQPVDLDFKKKKGETIGGEGERAPMALDIAVTFDTTSGILTIFTPLNIPGSALVYNINGALEGTSQTLNATFILPKNDIHILSLQGEDWIGEGKIVF